MVRELFQLARTSQPRSVSQKFGKTAVLSTTQNTHLDA